MRKYERQGEFQKREESFERLSCLYTYVFEGAGGTNYVGDTHTLTVQSSLERILARHRSIEDPAPGTNNGQGGDNTRGGNRWGNFILSKFDCQVWKYWRNLSRKERRWDEKNRIGGFCWRKDGWTVPSLGFFFQALTSTFETELFSSLVPCSWRANISCSSVAVRDPFEAFNEASWLFALYVAKPVFGFLNMNVRNDLSLGRHSVDTMLDQSFSFDDAPCLVYTKSRRSTMVYAESSSSSFRQGTISKETKEWRLAFHFRFWMSLPFTRQALD